MDFAEPARQQREFEKETITAIQEVTRGQHEWEEVWLRTIRYKGQRQQRQRTLWYIGRVCIHCGRTTTPYRPEAKSPQAGIGDGIRQFTIEAGRTEGDSAKRGKAAKDTRRSHIGWTDLRLREGAVTKRCTQLNDEQWMAAADRGKPKPDHEVGKFCCRPGGGYGTTGILTIRKHILNASKNGVPTITEENSWGMHPRLPGTEDNTNFQKRWQEYKKLANGGTLPVEKANSLKRVCDIMEKSHAQVKAILEPKEYQIVRTVNPNKKPAAACGPQEVQP